MLLCAAAFAAAPPVKEKPSHLRVWVEPGLAGAMGPEKETSLGGGTLLNLGLSLGAHPEKAVGLEVHLRELFVTEELRNIGNIGVLLRYPSGNGLHTGVGFSHNHEQDWDAYVADIGGSIAGTSDVLNHRTGFEVLAGYDFDPTAPAEATFANRFRMSTQVSAVVLPGTPGPAVYVLLEFGVRIGLTKPAAAL